MSKHAPLPPLLTRPFALLTAGHFLQALGFSSFMLFPVLLSALDASRTEIGLVMATGSLAGLISRPLVGMSLDSAGRKPTLLVGTLLVAASMGSVAFIDGYGWVAYACRVLFGIGVGALFTGYMAFASDVVPAERRTEGLALFGVSGLLPLLVNPLSARIGFAGTELRWFLPAVAIFVLASLPLMFSVPEKPRPAVRVQRSWATTKAAMTAKPLWSVWLAAVVFSGLVSVFGAFVSVAATKRGVADPTLVWLTYPLCAAAVRVVGARLPDRLGPRNLVTPALTLYAFAYLLAAESTTMSGYLWAGALAGVAHGYGFPVLTTQVVGRIPAELRGSGLAVFTGLWGLSEIVFTPLFGAISDHFGDPVMFGAGAFATTLSIAAWARLEWKYGVPVNSADVTYDYDLSHVSPTDKEP